MNTQLLLLINSWAGKNVLLDHLMIFCARYLLYIVFIIAAGIIAYLIHTCQRRALTLFGATLAIDFVLLQVAARVYALFFADHRPFVDHHLTQLISHAAGRSFPSNHTTVAVAIGMGLLLFTNFKKWGIFVLVSALVIGFARVFCGVHYPIDIIGAIVIGVVGAYIIKGVSKVAIEKMKQCQKIPTNQ